MRVGWTLLLAAATALAACGGGDDAASTTASVVDVATTASPATTAATDVAATDVVTTEALTSAPTTDAPTSDTQPVGAAPITVVDDRGVEVVIESADRIVPVDGDLAEIVWALGLGDNVVATDISATYPDAADTSTKIGYQRALSPEPILEQDPTVVLATAIAGPPETLTDLERTGVPVVIVPTPPTVECSGDCTNLGRRAIDGR
ncbi:MAG: ABC transporter substrate-binding protein, partial [Actinomycetota bacterium]